MLPAFVPDKVPRMPFGALVLTAVVLLSALAEAQTGSGLAGVRARLLASNGGARGRPRVERGPRRQRHDGGGGTLRGTAVGSTNRTLPIEFVKDGIR